MAHSGTSGVVVILGAGASTGADVSNPPPIVGNFIRDARQRHLTTDYQPLWDLLEGIGYPLQSIDEGTPNIEELYGALQVLSSGLWYSGDKEYLEDTNPKFWKIPPVYLLQTLILEVVTPPSLSAIQKPCIHHNRLVSSLASGDTIISFNYDLIVEASLKNLKIWNEHDGYGFVNTTSFMLEEKRKYASLNRSSEIRLLKPHGSINWSVYDARLLSRDVENPSHEIRDDSPMHPWLLKWNRVASPYLSVNFLNEILDNATKHKYRYPLYLPWSETELWNAISAETKSEEQWRIKGVIRPRPGPFITPPTIYKDITSPFPREIPYIWIDMRRALVSAKRIVVIGYSFSPVDLHFNTMFRLAIRKNKTPNLPIDVVDPYNAHTIAGKLHELAPHAKVNTFEQEFAEYVAAL